MKNYTITLTEEEMKMIRTSLDTRADGIADEEKANKYYGLSEKLMGITKQSITRLELLDLAMLGGFHKANGIDDAEEKEKFFKKLQEVFDERNALSRAEKQKEA